jgi:hypothetical protein
MKEWCWQWWKWEQMLLWKISAMKATVSVVFFTRTQYRVFILWYEDPMRPFSLHIYTGNERMGIRKWRKRGKAILENKGNGGNEYLSGICCSVPYNPDLINTTYRPVSPLPLALLFSLPPSLIGCYIQSTQSGHGVTIRWHRFCSQLQIAEWRQIE